MNTWEFDTTTGEGSEIVTIVYEYEQDEDSTYAENIRDVLYEGRSVLGLFGKEQFAELEMEAAMRFDHHKINYKYEDV